MFLNYEINTFKKLLNSHILNGEHHYSRTESNKINRYTTYKIIVQGHGIRDIGLSGFNNKQEHVNFFRELISVNINAHRL